MEMRCKREEECQAHKEMVRSFMAKEAEWKWERKRWKEEVAELRMRIREKDESIRRLEEKAAVAMVKGGKEWQGISASIFVQQMREEHERREEAVEKWKRLYLAIKTELDQLIHRTGKGERLWLRAEEGEEIEALKAQLNAKEQSVAALQMQIATMAKEGAKREREVDMIKQSLRILGHAKQTHLSEKLRTRETKSNQIKKPLA